jgi:hypothetical protein
LQRLAEFLNAEAFEKAPRGWATVARGLEAIRAACEWLLVRAYGEPAAVISISEPDKLARRKEADARDTVASFLMRKKRYAVVGLDERMRDASLSEPRREHALHTLALISGRNFHREDRNRFANADRWLERHVR